MYRYCRAEAVLLSYYYCVDCRTNDRLLTGRHTFPRRVRYFHVLELKQINNNRRMLKTRYSLRFHVKHDCERPISAFWFLFRWKLVWAKWETTCGRCLNSVVFEGTCVSHLPTESRVQKSRFLDSTLHRSRLSSCRRKQHTLSSYM